MLTELYHTQNRSGMEPSTFIFINSGEGAVSSYSSPQNMIDVPNSLGDYNVNCCHTDVSLSVRLFIL
jgi:hypothetical protein